MACGRRLSSLLAFCLLTDVLSAPTAPYRWRRGYKEADIIEQNEKDVFKVSTTTTSTTTENNNSDDDDIDFDEEFNSPQSSNGGGGGSNLISLLNIANALFPASSRTTKEISHMIRNVLSGNRAQLAQRRRDTPDNEIEIDYATKFRPPTFERQESSESSGSDTSESLSEDSDDSSSSEESSEKQSKENSSGGDSTKYSNSNDSADNNSGSEVIDNSSGSNSKENNSGGNSNSKQDSDSNGSNENDSNDSDYDEPPSGDGEGGGVLGLLAGLSNNGDSDLGTLLATVGGILMNLSGDGVDLGSIIATALGLLVGLLSDGQQNPGEIIASYLRTAVDTISGGGAKNNGAFFGKFISTLIKGISAAGDGEEDDENAMPMTDSAGFVLSLIMGLLGDMSKSSFGGSSSPWR